MPAYLRHYPFFAFQTKAGERSIFIEENCSRLQEAEGLQLFQEDQPTETLNKIVKDMTFIFESAILTQKMLDSLQEHELIVPWNAEFLSQAGEKVSISEVFCVDENALNKLSNSAFNELRELNAFPMIYGQLYSMHNLGKLVLHQNIKLRLADQDALGVKLDAQEQEINFDLAESGDTLDFDNL